MAMNGKSWTIEITADDLMLLNAAQCSIDSSKFKLVMAHIFGKKRRIKTQLNDVEIISYRGVNYFWRDLASR